jgi:enediyne biosynthesis protein E5
MKTLTHPLTLPHVQLVLALGSYVLLGLTHLDFSLTLLDAVLAVGTAVTTEYAWHLYAGRRGESRPAFAPWSALAAGLGIAIFLRASDPTYFALASFVAISSKYVIRFRGTHIFNPSNLAILAVVILFPVNATIEFTQWGSDPFVFAVIAAVSYAIAYRAGVIATTASFLLSYSALLLLFVVHAQETYAAHHLGLIGPSLVLFASFMITDPKTSPSGFLPRVVHGTSVAFAYFFLEFLAAQYALFVASFAVTCLNFASNRLIERLPSLPSITRRVRNIVTLSVALLLFFISYATLAHARPLVSVQVPSLRFFLMGIESSSLYACRDSTSILKETDAGVGIVAHTNGAAWGDYDGDGFDDLFVSNIDAPSILYKNLGDGTFADVTSVAGLPSLYASSAVFFDYDDDRDPELLVATVVPATPDHRVGLALFQNRGGTFTDRSREAGLSDSYPRGVGFLSAADYDADGMLDFVLTTSGVALRSAGARETPLAKTWWDPFFNGRNVTLACGDDALAEVSPLFSAEYRFALRSLRSSYPADERLCAYFGTSLPIFPGVNLPSLNRDAAVNPQLIIPGRAYVFMRRGDRFVRDDSFTELVRKIQERTTVANARINGRAEDAFSGRLFQPLSFDFDGNGLPDIFLASDFGTNLLLKNTREGFIDASEDAGVSYFATGMGVDIADWNNDGNPDLAVSNVHDDYILEGNGAGLFVNRYAELPIARMGLGWGISFFDYDGDQWTDIMVTNGTGRRAVGEQIESALARPLFRLDNLYRNNQGVRYSETSGRHMCPGVTSGNVLAPNDFDNDGDVDMFVGTVHSGNAIYTNLLPRDGLSYLSVSLRGRVSNSDGIGASVTVVSDTASQTKYRVLGSGFGTAGSSRLFFGLADEAGPVEVQVRWPSGKETHMSVMPNRHVEITE